ncbi:MAG: hypothetical protein AAGH68_07320 [Pseudomonadota bacterium]
MFILNQLEKHNAMAMQMIAELHQAALPALDWTRARLRAMLIP